MCCLVVICFGVMFCLSSVLMVLLVSWLSVVFSVGSDVLDNMVFIVCLCIVVWLVSFILYVDSMFVSGCVNICVILSVLVMLYVCWLFVLLNVVSM